MEKLVKRIIVVSVVFVVGCSSPGIVKLSPDTYMLTKEDHGGIFAFNRGAMKTDAIREANAFAENQGKIAIPVASHEHPVGILGDWASFEYQFKVVDKNDPDARRTALVPRPDVVIDKTEKIYADVRTKDQTEKPKDMYAELIKLDDLRKKGIINESEFDAQKKRILNGN
jgi:hypothetical protein